MTFFDTHCHTYLCKEKNETEILDELKNSRNFFIWNVWVDLKTSKHVIDLSEKYNFVYAIIWIQPENIWDFENINTTIKELEILAKNKKVVSIWECGLDYYWLERTESWEWKKKQNPPPSIISGQAIYEVEQEQNPPSPLYQGGTGQNLSSPASTGSEQALYQGGIGQNHSISLWKEGIMGAPLIKGEVNEVSRGILERKKQIQKEWFIAQINLAKKLDLPIVIHNRDAWEDVFEILKQTNFKNFIMHCYSENLEYAKKLIDFSPNCKISFSWILSFKNAKELQDVAKNIPLENIIIETDSPYLAPVPYRWKENNPLFVEKVFEKLCELREENHEVIKNQIWKNSLEIFKIKKS